MTFRLSWLTLLLFLSFLTAYAQQRELTTTNSRAKRAFEEALNKVNMGDIKGAEDEFMNAVRIDPMFIEVYIVMGEIYQDENRHEDAIDVFEKALAINQDFYPNMIYYLGESYMLTGKYEAAMQNFNLFLQKENVSQQMLSNAGLLKERAEFAINAIENPVPFNPLNLGENINSKYDEYAPTLTADESTLLFTRKGPMISDGKITNPLESEDFFISRKIDDAWDVAQNLGSPINTDNNEGMQSLSADGMYLFFTACNRPSGLGSCDIYFSRKMGNGWSEPVNLEFPVNTSSWDSQPSLSADGKTLYFASNRGGSYGGSDIWVTTFLENGTWTVPRNLGTVINTPGREMSPFIHPDNQTLYFASDGHIGMGKLDIYYSRKDDNGEWGAPVNLGYPINTFAEEMSLTVTASGKEAWFASQQPGGQGGSDLYSFELYEEARPTPVTYMKGFVFDKDSHKGLLATFELINLQTGEMIVSSFSDELTGEFLVPIPLGTNLGLNVRKEGFLFFSENFAFNDPRTNVDPHLYDIPLQPIREGEAVVLRNIFFKVNSHELLPESITELRRLLELLQQNPALLIEIGGHTDNTGTAVYNQSLSERRAQSVLAYLAENGINAAQLKSKGYGDTQPVATNDTEEGRAQNRRTEFKVISTN